MIRPRHILLPVAAAGWLVEELYAYILLRRSSKLFSALLDRRGHQQDYYTARDTAASALRERPQERWTITSERGEPLQGFYFPGTGARKRVAFVIHGYRSEHADTAGRYYDFWAERGFDLFCCDHTAHGESGGAYIGFSVFEAEDCLRWVDTLITRLGSDVEIVLHGFSMGAATVLRMTDRLPPQVKFVIEDSGFMSAEGQLRDQTGPLYPVLRWMHMLVAGCDLSDGDTRTALERATVPILFAHGMLDRTVPYENGPALYEFYTGPKASLFVEGARHIESFHVAPERYAEAVDAMITQYM